MNERALIQQMLQSLEPLVQRASPYGEQDWLDGKESIQAARDYLAAREDDEDDSRCPTCGEDGGTSCGAVNCGMLQEAPEQSEQRGHIASGDCWCNPELDYKDPTTDAEVWIHKEPQ